MPRPKGAGRASDERFRALRDKLIDELLDDADDREVDTFVRKLQRMADRAFKKSMRKGGCVGLGDMSPPESVAMAGNVLTLARAMEAREAIKERRVKRKSTMMALIAAVEIVSGSQGEDDRPAEVRVIYADGVKQDGDTTQPTTESGASETEPEK